MQPTVNQSTPEDDLFRQRLENILDTRHALCRLAEQMPWAQCTERFGALYAERGRPGLPLRLLVGLQYLKHVYALSDEEVVAQWVENPYWQYFCGEEYFQHTLPLDPSQMTRFRQRIGEAGCEWLLQLTIEVGVQTKTVRPAHLQNVSVDTTVQPKAVAFPTDARLYLKGLRTLVRRAKQAGVPLRQSYTRLAKAAFIQHGRYAKAKQFKRARRMQKKLKVYLGRVVRDVQRKVTATPEWAAAFQNLLARLTRLLSQQRQDTGKLYSVHAPEVECLAKGKAHKPYEFGVKVSLATTQTKNFVVGIQALAGNPYDGHTLANQLEQVERLTGHRPRRCVVDQGYRGHGMEASETEVLVSRQRQRVTPAQKRALRRRNAIEPLIGHLKSDGFLGRNFLKGVEGDKLNALLCGAGQNLRTILRQLRIFLRRFGMGIFWLRLACQSPAPRPC
jgi:IS5 family transposase